MGGNQSWQRGWFPPCFCCVTQPLFIPSETPTYDAQTPTDTHAPSISDQNLKNKTKQNCSTVLSRYLTIFDSTVGILPECVNHHLITRTHCWHSPPLSTLIPYLKISVWRYSGVRLHSLCSHTTNKYHKYHHHHHHYHCRPPRCQYMDLLNDFCVSHLFLNYRFGKFWIS